MEAAEWIRTKTDIDPDVAIVLGSGLGDVARQIEADSQFDFADIPGFSQSTAAGHRGQLILGTLQGCRVVAMAGRLHRYEGHTRDAVTRPVRVMQALGARTLILSNAAGGLNPAYEVGDLVIIDDHIDWQGGGPNLGVATCLGLPTRMANVYDLDLRAQAIAAGLTAGFVVHRGTYLATLGPTYETRAEYRMMRRLGADLAGMSTVPEAIAGAALGMRVLAVSMVSNVANPDAPQVASHEEVLEAGRAAATRLETIVRRIVNTAASRTIS